MLLANLTITTAVTAQTTPVAYVGNGAFMSADIQGNFTYGSGGTTVAAYVQTSLDNGTTWCDVASFSYTTTSGCSIFNPSTTAGVIAPITPTDGSLTANTAIDGVLGNLWRVKYTTTGTYAGNTTLQIALVPRGPFGGSAL